MNGSNSDLIKQIHAVRKYDLNGMIIFDYAHLNENYIDALKESIFRPCKKNVILIDNNCNLEKNTNDKDKKTHKKGKKKRGRRK